MNKNKNLNINRNLEIYDYRNIISIQVMLWFLFRAGKLKKREEKHFL